MARIRLISCIALVAGAFFLSAGKAEAQPGGPGGFGRPGPGHGAGHVDIGVFYQALAPYGEWIHMPPYGWVWMPYDTGYDWRPYTNGYWIWTECGWTWVSNEPYGWAVYHYGRWQYTPWNGWVWVPGTQWGPGWVAWRRGNGFVGWAPLPASTSQTSFNLQIGNFAFEVNQIKNHAWSFMEERWMDEPNISHYIARPARNVNIIQNTHNITNYNITNNTIVNNSLSRRVIEDRIKRPVRQFKIDDFDRPGFGGIQRDRNVVRFFRPKLGDKPKQTPDVVFKKNNRVTLSNDAKARELAQKQEIERRLAAERANLEDRNRREAARLGKLGISAEELKRRHEREAQAFKEQEARIRKLHERDYDRLKKGNGGYTESKNEGRFDRFDKKNKKD